MTDGERIPKALPRELRGGRIDTKAELAKLRDNRLRRKCLPVCWDCARLQYCGMDTLRACARAKEIVEMFEKENGK